MEKQNDLLARLKKYASELEGVIEHERAVLATIPVADNLHGVYRNRIEAYEIARLWFYQSAPELKPQN